jgi:MFS family permease
MLAILKTFFGKEFVEVLFYPPYLLFTISVIFSQVAVNMMNVVLIFLVFSITSSNLLSSVLIITFMIPQIFLSFIGGVVADIYNKKMILFHGNVMRAVILLLLFALGNSVFLLYIISFLIAVVSQFYIPSETPVIPKLVKRKHLGAANSIFSVGMFGSVLVGYVLAGPALSFFGNSNIFIFLAGLFAIGSIAVALIPKDLLYTEKNGEHSIFTEFHNHVKSELKKTYKLVNELSGVGTAFMLLALSQIIILVIASVISGYAESVLQIPPERMSLYVFAPAVAGIVISSLLLGRLPHRKLKKEGSMMMGVMMSGVAMLLFPFMSKIASRDFIIWLNSFLPELLVIDTLHLTILLAFITGFANALIFIPSQVIIQDKVPEIFRAKFYGLLYALIGVFSLVPIVFAGIIADVFGVSSVLFGIGFFILTVGVVKWGSGFFHIKNFALR